MRDLLDKLSLLVESTGLAGRKPGDTFKNPNGDIITFKSINFYPAAGGKLDKESLDQELADLTDTDQIQWQNSRTAKTGGFIIATFDTPSGEVNYGFYKDVIKPNPTDNYVPNQIGDYRFAGKSAEKIQSGLTPQDLLTKRDNLTSAEIIDQLAKKLGQDNILVQVARMIASGQEFPIRFPAPEGVSFTGFRDYFCEILQPMALQTGQYTGNAGEAAKRFMGGSFSDSLISFDSAKNAGLSDSILTSEGGKYIKISTKGGKGAQASVKNLSDSIKELEKSPNGKKLSAKYKDVINLINNIESWGQVYAPLQLGVEYGVIDEEDMLTIIALRDEPSISIDEVEGADLSDNLKKLAIERSTDNPESVNLFYHLVASVAHLVATKINDKTNFSDAASDILNNGALVQVYTKAKESGKEWVLENFDTIYPGESIEGVYLSASKNYFSTGIKGNFTFRINRGDPVQSDSGKGKKSSSKKDSQTEKDFEKGAAAIARGLRKPKQEPKTDKSIGREKRKK